MPEDLIRYDVLVQEALRGVVRKVLGEAARVGLPGDHHFYITFATQAPGVRISSRLRHRYPDEMTIVLQHQFWDLQVSEQAFEVALSFGQVPETLLVPFTAIKGFFDPSVKFGLQLEAAKAADVEADAAEPKAGGRAPLAAVPDDHAARGSLPMAKAGPAEPAAPTTEGDATGETGDEAPKVVSLDSFRKKS